MSTTYCITCDDCLLVNADCICLNTPLSTNVGKRLLGMARKAQKNFVVDTLQKDCFDQLCAALENDAKPEGQGRVPLEERWVTLMTEYIVPLLTAATYFCYLSLYRFDKISIVVSDEESYIKERRAEVFRAQNNLKDFLADNTDVYDCHCATVKDPCDPHVGYTDPSLDFVVLSRYGTMGFHPYENDPDFKTKHRSGYPKKKSNKTGNCDTGDC